MSTNLFHKTTTLAPEQYIAGLTDFGSGRSKLFGNSADEYLKVHGRSRSQTKHGSEAASEEQTGLATNARSL